MRATHRTARTIWWVPLLAILAACGGGAPEEEPESGEAVAVAEPEVSDEADAQDEPRARPFLPASMQRASRVETFPHDTHAEISCNVCHDQVQGHASHSDLTCAECHRSSALVTRETVSRDECLSCHHGPLQERDCADCHGDVGQRVATWPMHLGIWSGPRNRSLPFQHAVHEARDCANCHVERPTLRPNVECASCHQDHHRPEARCMTCHAQPREGAHTVQAHLSCSGAGCHTDPRFADLTFERATCLVCHQAQEEHEPGQECAECHQVRG